MPLMYGHQLSDSTKRDALALYVHRFTVEHIPQWAKKPRPDGQPYKPQFASDLEWLENTLFHVTNAGKLSNRHKYCKSQPTWPKGL